MEKVIITFSDFVLKIMQYQQPFFKSTDKKIEDQYGLGIYFLEKKEYEKAYENFVLAADNGHISACFNLYLRKSCKTLRNVWYMSACNGILTGHEAKQP